MKSPLLLLLSFLAFSAAAQPAPGPMMPREGAFVFGPATALAADEALLPLAHYAAEYLGRPVRQQMTGTGAVVLTLEPGEPSEAYRLEIAPDYIRIGATSPGGAFNGLQALFRLLPPEVYAQQGISDGTALTCGIAADRPKYSYRGMMLDVARTWVEVPMLKRFINLLSYHNINKLHLHLADDDGWRIQIKSHPELAEVGGFRGGDSPVAPVYGKWSEKYGGYYTQDEMRSLIEYAALRNIEIIPEIDLPGHSRCIGSVRPEIRCSYPPDTVTTAGTDYRSAWCVAREENYALLEEILGEICELFPSPYIHIGGDEVEVAQWKKCPDCRAMMKRLGTVNPHRLQDYFMERLAAMLAARGKRPAVWNEAAASGTFTRTSRVHGWTSVGACHAATAKGYRTVIMPSECFYFDMRQTLREEGHSWASIFDARRTYEFDPAARASRTDSCATWRVSRGRSGPKSTLRTSPKSPTTWITCVFRESAPWRAWHGAATTRGGRVTTASWSPTTTTGWPPWASASGFSRRSSATQTERSPPRPTTIRKSATPSTTAARSATPSPCERPSRTATASSPATRRPQPAGGGQLLL